MLKKSIGIHYLKKVGNECCNEITVFRKIAF